MSGFSAFAAALLLAAGVAAAVSAVTVRISLEKPPRIASVRLSGLTARYITRSLREGGDSKKALAEAREWAGRLEVALARTAARRGVVLLTAGAVAAGGEDLTAEVEAAMAELATRKHTPKKEENIK
ncbi:MAG: TrbI F-type domain-containing protein [Nitrospinae bacterium]|nr:TrbI F-type domain-containing protein [Nitrospinota bacterium]